MTQDDRGKDQDNTEDVQFDQVEYTGPAQAPAGVVCAACKQNIPDVYFTAGQAIVCTRCRDGWMAHQSSGSGAKRFFGALALGLIAAVVGSLIWYGVRVATGYEIGLVAIVVGLIVGAGVRRGSQMRGGWLYQTMAILLTYCAIVSQYVPDVYQMIVEHMNKEQVAATQPADRAATTRPAAVAGTTKPAAMPQARSSRPKDVSAGKAILALLIVGAVLFAIAFVAPILAGFSNIIGLLIIGFALYEAWKLNKRVVLAFEGPFAVGTQAPPPGPTA